MNTKLLVVILITEINTTLCNSNGNDKLTFLVSRLMQLSCGLHGKLLTCNECVIIRDGNISDILVAHIEAKNNDLVISC